MNFFAERFGANGFLNEHLWLGHLGHFFVVFGFFAALLAAVAYFADEQLKAEDSVWKKIARVSFTVHGTMVIGVFVLLFIMILNHWFEYHYAWRHSSNDLPIEYVISSFWEGQEGSFLLWEFWIVILGWVFMATAKKWESPVMFVVAVTQVFLGSMVLGITVLGQKIGSNPFILLRDEMAAAPIFQRPEYLSMIEDGNGLNPLLQNYWMTIHPPVLFLGFAASLFPFAFAFASLWRKDYKDWVKPALPWVLFCLAILGTGILMGGAWAYESLSFGGFWAWDPVENMSFVPWLLILAGLHLHLIYKYTNHGLFTTYLFYMLGWLLVLYSTFLTRSGILGDTSVHAFTDLGMSGQLIIYGVAYLVPSIILIALRYKSLPKEDKEEEFFSREFWMFIGSLIMVLSAFQMIFTTSIPVWNKVFGLNLAPPADVIAHYNNIQIWIALIACIGIASVQFLAYKSSRIPALAKWAVYSFGIALAAGIAIAYFTEVELIVYFGKEAKIPFLSPYLLLLILSVYAAVASLAYIFIVLKGKIKLSGGAITHFGFGVFLIGVLISQHKKEVVSLNTSGVNFGKEFEGKEQLENVLLFRDSAYMMSDYFITYTGMRAEKSHKIYDVNYVKKDMQSGAVKEQFTLSPYVVMNERMGNSSNPSTKHYLTKDIFTHVVAAADMGEVKDTTVLVEAAVGDTFYLTRNYIVFKSINPKPEVGLMDQGKLAVAANLFIGDLKGTAIDAIPIFFIDQRNNNEISTHTFEDKTLGLSIDITRINPETKKFTFAVKEKKLASDFIIMKAIIFPYINLVWLGGIITFLGILMSMWRRRSENKD
jgi:cytochrome c-type biogenesis protein CcmF